MYKRLLDKFLRLLLVVSVVVSAYFLLKYTISFVYPIIFAVLISFMIEPFVTFLQHKLKLRRALATLIIMFVLFLCFTGMLIFLITELIQGTTYLAENIPASFQIVLTYVEDLLEFKILPFYDKITSFILSLNSVQQATIHENIQQSITYLTSNSVTLLQNFLFKIPNLLMILPQSFIIFGFIILATFLITNDWHDLKAKIIKIIPTPVYNTSKNIMMHLKQTLFGFMKAQVMLVSITAGVICIGLLILQVEHAFTITLIAGFIDLLPYVGTGFIFIPWIFYLFITENYSMTIGLTTLYIFIIILRQIIEPKIIAVNIGIKPLTTLITLFIGFQLFGVIGIVIAPLTLIIISSLYQAGVIKDLWKFLKG